MLQFELINPNARNSTPRLISLPDDARGADLYLYWQRRGFQFRRVGGSPADAE